MTALEKLLEPFPQSDVEHKQNMAYIAHDKIRLRVIEATDNHFDWVVGPPDYRTDGVVRPRENKRTGEISIPPVMIVTGVLTIPGLGSRTGIGVQTLEAGSGEDMYKGAESDAFKRAAMSFGVALKQLYTDDGKPQAVPDEGPLYMPPEHQDAWIELIQAANELDGKEQQDALNGLVKQAQLSRNAQQIELLIEHLDTYENANKVAEYFLSKNMLSGKGRKMIQDRTADQSA